MKNTTEATPAPSTASTRPSAAGSVSAMGFSSSRCLPSRAACVAMAACTSGGTANDTASTAARNAETSRYGVAWYSAARPAAA